MRCLIAASRRIVSSRTLEESGRRMQAGGEGEPHSKAEEGQEGEGSHGKEADPVSEEEASLKAYR